MDLPADVLLAQLGTHLTRGRIIRFKVDDFDDPRRTTGFKFAIVLNKPDVIDPIWYVFATSKTEYYDATLQFQYIVLDLAAGSYPCFPLRTLIPFREVRSIARAKLEQQYVHKELTIAGELSEAHLATVSEMIARSPTIVRRVKKLITIDPVVTIVPSESTDEIV